MDEVDGRLVGGLVVLAALADARSFGRAAERLGMTQSGVSDRCRGASTRGWITARAAVELTEEGRAGRTEAPRIWPGSARRRRRPRNRAMVRGRLRVIVDPLFSRMVLSPKLSEFLLQNPGMEQWIETFATGSRTWSATVSTWRCVRAGAVGADCAACSMRACSPWPRRSISNDTAGRVIRGSSRVMIISASTRSTRQLDAPSIGSSGAAARSCRSWSTGGSP